MVALSAASLGALPAPVAVPAHDRSHVRVGIVHLGVGGFHRSASDRIPKFLLPVLLRVREVFGDLAGDERFAAAYRAQLASLRESGVRATAEALVRGGRRRED